jgi:hypothetical protein
MLKRTSCIVLAVVFGIGVLPVLGVGGQSSYLPLAEGWSWNYTFNGTTLTSTVGGSKVVLGVPTTIITNGGSGTAIEETVENYWTVDAGGNVYLYGFTSYALVLSYDPPLCFIDEPLFVGKQWSIETQRYSDLEGTTPFGEPVTITYEVTAMEDHTVPAGTFSAYAIGQMTAVQLIVNGKAHSILGYPRALGSAEDTNNWYASGVGPIQRYVGFDPFVLSGWTDPSSPIRRMTWGAAKAKFHKGNGPSN